MCDQHQVHIQVLGLSALLSSPSHPLPARPHIPPLLQNCKYAVQRDVLPDGTVVPAGAQVIYSPYVVNRLEGVWGADALTFRPERWLEMDKAPSPYAYLTFNAGGGGGGGSSKQTRHRRQQRWGRAAAQPLTCYLHSSNPTV